MQYRTSRGLLLGGVLVVALAAGGWSSRMFPTQLHQTFDRQPTPFTELYFTSASSLPKVLRPDQPSRFEFTIVNHEREATTYRYVVSGAAAETSQPIGSGDVTLPTGFGTSVPVSFVPSVLGADYVVTVRLADRVETVHFATHS